MSNPDWQKNVEFWSKLQERIHKQKIKMYVSIPHRPGPWAQKLNGRKIIMDISPEISDGLYTYLVVTFYGLIREKDLDDLSRLMGYYPFVSYKNTEDNVSKTTYEWAHEAKERFEDLQKMKNLCSIICLEDSFRRYNNEVKKESYTVSTRLINTLVGKVAKDPESTWHDIPIRKITPLFRTVRPVLAKKQVSEKIVLISMKITSSDETWHSTIDYALHPLIVRKIIGKEEVKRIKHWFWHTVPGWKIGNELDIKKFKINNVVYQLHLETYRRKFHIILSAY